MKYCIYCMKEKGDAENICPHCYKDNSEYTSDAHVLPAGTVLNDSYLIGAVLGEGGFGITYICKDLLLEKTVAIKEFYPTGMVSRNNTYSTTVTSISNDKSKHYFVNSKEIFWKEAKILAGFRDEQGIVSVLAFFTANNTAYIVTEYLDGETLADYLKRVGRLSYNDTAKLLTPVTESLKKVHEKKLIHRDISPDNIMLVNGSAVLIDFGATRQYADNRSLSVILKEGYAPIEQYSSKGRQGTWTDVYALCAVIYRCITGQIPLSSADRSATNEQPELPTALGANISESAEQVLMNGLALKVEDRIQTIGELMGELDKASREESVSELQKSKPDLEPVPQKLVDEDRLSRIVSEENIPRREATKKPEKEAKPAAKPYAESERLSRLVSEEEISSLMPPPESEPPKPALPEPPEPKTDTPVSVKKSKGIIVAAAAILLFGGIVGGIAVMSGKNKVPSEQTAQTSISETTTAATTNADATTTASGNESESKAEFTIEQIGNDSLLTKYNGTGGIVVIPDGVTVIDDSAFSKCASVTNVIISDSVTRIGKSAFENCTLLESVTIPAGVMSIGEYAFSRCNSLISVDIPDSVTRIGKCAFYDCISLKSVNIPKGVTSIGEGVFNTCKSLKRVTIPDNVTSIGKFAFYECTSLADVTIPNSVTNINKTAFEGCSSLSINCQKGSAAEQFAKKNNITYTVSLEKGKSTTTAPGQTSKAAEKTTAAPKSTTTRKTTTTKKTTTAKTTTAKKTTTATKTTTTLVTETPKSEKPPYPVDYGVFGVKENGLLFVNDMSIFKMTYEQLKSKLDMGVPNHWENDAFVYDDHFVFMFTKEKKTLYAIGWTTLLNYDDLIKKAVADYGEPLVSYDDRIILLLDIPTGITLEIMKQDDGAYGSQYLISIEDYHNEYSD